jgi:hypothetical protein
MMALFKLLLLATVLAAAFATGYLMGATETSNLRHTLTAVEMQLADTTRKFEGELSGLRVRMQLMTARNALASAEAELGKRNFGSAEIDLRRAQDALRNAARSASGAPAERLKRLDAALERAIREAAGGKPAPGRVKALRDDLEEMLS